MFTFTILCLSFFSSLVHAVPLISRFVFDPPITNPTAKTVWTAGTVQTVTWNTTGIPTNIPLPGMVMLGFLANDSEHLSTTLASGFNLTDGNVSVTVPLVVTRDDYIVVVFGDSGNASPKFTIKGVAASSSGVPSATVSASRSVSAVATSSSSITTPISISGTVVTGGATTATLTDTDVSVSSTTPLSTVAPSSTVTSPSSVVTSPSSVGTSTSSSSSISGSSLSSSSSSTTSSPSTTSSNTAFRVDPWMAYPFGLAVSFLLLVL